MANNASNIDFWKIAAYNEFENNFNSLVARNIFQKCIRINRNTILSYLEYFIFELKFVEKIVNRKKALTDFKGKELHSTTNNYKEQDNTKILKIIDDNIANEKTNNIKIDEKEEIISDDILDLKVCEIIWYKARNELSKNNIMSLLDIDLNFFIVLLQYGKATNYKNLKAKIINEIRNSKEKENFEIEIEIIKAKLEKYTLKVIISKIYIF